MIAAGIGLLYLGFVYKTVTVPMLVALGLAYAFEPLIAWASNRWDWATRGRCIVAAFSTILVTLALVIILVLPAVLREGAGLVQASGGYLQQGKELLLQADIPDALKLWLDQLPENELGG